MNMFSSSENSDKKFKEQKAIRVYKEVNQQRQEQFARINI